MANKRIQDSYKELIKYFSDANQDGFSKLVSPGSDALKFANTSGLSNHEFVTLMYNFLYADSIKQESFSDMIKSMNHFDKLDLLKESFCITPYDEPPEVNVPYNFLSWETPQGSHNFSEKTYKKPSGKTYKIKDIVKNASIDESINKVNAIQVWSSDLPPHGADAEISALFLNSISNIVMSQAVPYIDILVSTSVGDAVGSLSNANFSLGRFLGKNKNEKEFDQDASAQFLGNIGKSVASKVIGKNKLQAVASMEIFTSPQTLINSENSSYNELNPGRIDAFRPFLNLESFNVQVLATGFGSISKKTADMQLTLFDKGRLQDIAPLVSPLAYNTVQLDITYGWSHPSGNSTNGRISGANSDDKLGEFIDAMKVTDVFTVANSDYKFEKDGTVKINLKLISTGMTKFTSESLDLSSSIDNKDTTNVENINSMLNALKTKLSGKTSKELFLPVSILDGSFDGFISLEKEDIEKIRKIVSNLSKSGKTLKNMAEVKDTLSKLVGVGKAKNKKGTVDDGELGKFQSSQMKTVKIFIDHLIDTPDPFLPTTTLAGVSEKQINENFYSSFGKILIASYSSFFQRTGEVMFIFGCFNENAAAIRDLNVSQFPILIKGTSEKSITLQSVLEKHYKSNKNITPDKFLQLLIDNFINVQSNEAYGLKDAFDLANPDKKASSKKNKKVSLEDGGAILREALITTQLKKIYSDLGVDVNDPKLTLPKISMSVDCRKTGSGDKNIVKVIIQDTAMDPGKTTGEFLTDILSQGFVLSPPKGSLNKFSPRHGTKLSKLIEVLNKRKIIKKMDVSSFPKNSLAVKEILDRHQDAYILDEKFASNITKLRNEFYKDFPTLIVGSMGSGIIDAQLSSQQNDALKTIAVSQAIRNNSDGNDPNIEYGMVLYPTQLTLEVFGSPVFKFMQRFFVDFGTNTSADNFYVITGINMNFSPGEFKCTLNMMVHDIFARTINIRKVAEEAMLIASKND